MRCDRLQERESQTLCPVSSSRRGSTLNMTDPRTRAQNDLGDLSYENVSSRNVPEVATCSKLGFRTSIADRMAHSWS